VYLTQTSIKTALSYSSIAHMGFSLMVCGLGVYPAAMLHLVAHSFYKAHAFLSSGSVIDLIRSSKIKKGKRIGSPIRIALGIVLGFALYIGTAVAWGIDPVNELSLLAIGGVIAMGLSRLFTSAIDAEVDIKVMLRAFLLSLMVTILFFVLESGTHALLASQLPELVAPTFTETILIICILLAFGVTVFFQIAAPTLSISPFYQRLAIHLRNGLYVNTVFDRTVRALYSHDSSH
jgi:NAD(P)H-quinone oxidoreductase subunit 5